MIATPTTELRETHSAVLVLFGDRAYKVKKPVDLGFLDFTTRARREIACHREVRLNRRMAPDVYLGVADVSGPDGQLCDHLVVMRRLPDEARLSRLAAEGHDLDATLWSVAHQLAALHAASSPAGPFADIGRAPALHRHWRENLDVVRAQARALPPSDDPDQVGHLDALVDRYLRGRTTLLDERVAKGCVVDGHGDLRAEDIFVLRDGPRVLDCLDFSDELRWGDRLLDAAFLAMDLDDLGRPTLAAAFLGWQRELSGDTWPRSLAHHYVAYRASVRAKVAAIRIGQGDDRAASELARFCRLTTAHLEAGRVRMILVGGLPGTGKSTLARTVADRAGAILVATDDVRRELGVAVHGPPPGVDEGRYSPGARAAVYDEVLRRAEALLERGEHVVLDASWEDAEQRLRARDVARRTATDLDEVECRAPQAITDARIAARVATRTGASEATVDVAHAMAPRFDPWPEATAFDTAAPATVVAERILTELGLAHLAERGPSPL